MAIQEEWGRGVTNNTTYLLSDLLVSVFRMGKWYKGGGSSFVRWDDDIGGDVVSAAESSVSRSVNTEFNCHKGMSTARH